MKEKISVSRERILIYFQFPAIRDQEKKSFKEKLLNTLEC